MTSARTPQSHILRRTRVLLGVGALGAALALTGCGSDSEADTSADDPAVTQDSATPTGTTDGAAAGPNGEPACSEVWVPGQDLPVDYQGCMDDTGTLVKPDVVNCSVGNTMILLDPNFYATPGHIIRAATPDYENDPAYQQVYMVCTG